MGLIIISMGVFILFSIFLYVSFGISVLINSKKVGFKKAIKSRTSLIFIFIIVICSCLPMLLSIRGFIPRSGEHLFKDYVLKPVPGSVEILDSFDGSPDFISEECLHFKISPDDFQLILASKEWETDSEPPYIGIQCDYENRAWDFIFPPPALGSDVNTYMFIPSENDFELMFTNDQMDEVYYYYVDGDLP
jgi:hypothetical protein